VNEKVPALPDDVPDNVPRADKLMPAGNCPLAKVQPYGAVPPDAPKLAVYGIFKTADPMEGVVMESGDKTLKVRSLVAIYPVLSLA